MYVYIAHTELRRTNAVVTRVAAERGAMAVPGQFFFLNHKTLRFEFDCPDREIFENWM